MKAALKETFDMSDFRIGEKAVYPAHGVAEVIGVEKKEINTSVCSFYVLKVLATGMQILVPKDKADQVGLRPVATSQEIEEVFDIQIGRASCRERVQMQGGA